MARVFPGAICPIIGQADHLCSRSKQSRSTPGDFLSVRRKILAGQPHQTSSQLCDSPTRTADLSHADRERQESSRRLASHSRARQPPANQLEMRQGHKLINVTASRFTVPFLALAVVATATAGSPTPHRRQRAPMRARPPRVCSSSHRRRTIARRATTTSRSVRLAREG
jgi:hypothetical protein